MCLNLVMDQFRGPIAAFIMLLLLGGCSSPISDPSKLKAIRGEAQLLMAAHPVTSPQISTGIPKERWPQANAGLHPHTVTLYHWGVSISIKPNFDGGWGYDLPQNKQSLPMPVTCYTEVSQGVFWHDPC